MNRTIEAVLLAFPPSTSQIYRLPINAQISKIPYVRKYRFALSLKLNIFLSELAVTKLMKIERAQNPSIVISKKLTVSVYYLRKVENAVMKGA